jgi:hypothetical protein
MVVISEKQESMAKGRDGSRTVPMFLFQIPIEMAYTASSSGNFETSSIAKYISYLNGSMTLSII